MHYGIKNECSKCKIQSKYQLDCKAIGAKGHVYVIEDAYLCHLLLYVPMGAMSRIHIMKPVNEPSRHDRKIIYWDIEPNQNSNLPTMLIANGIN